MTAVVFGNKVLKNASSTCNIRNRLTFDKIIKKDVLCTKM